MKFLHEHGVKGYVAFNTLIFTKELPDAETQLHLLEDSGVDAVIVQDLGLAQMVKALAPGLRLHASTQMTITSPEGLEFAKQLDIDQAVLARELSLRELERFKDARGAAGGLCAWRAVRGVFRPVPHQRIAGAAQCEPWRVRAGLPHAV